MDDLIETKLARPRLRDGIIERPRVLARLERGATSPVVLVSAPAGYGKTVAVESWLRRSDSAVAWVAVDAGDNDPVRLWRYVITAVTRACDGVGAFALERLTSPSGSVLPAIDELARRLAADGRRVSIVLEDLHEIDDERGLEALGHATRALPHNAQLVLITRTDPKLRLARMRSQGVLTELRARELAFTLDEARRLLVDAEGLALSEPQLALLVARTEGWAAALYLAALCLRDAPDVGEVLRRFDGVHRHLSEYLTAEVLEGLEPATRAFLLRTSVLPRFSAALCDHVLAEDGSAALIAQVQRSNLFLASLDDQAGWFRYHDLFRALLLAELEAADPGAATRAPPPRGRVVSGARADRGGGGARERGGRVRDRRRTARRGAPAADPRGPGGDAAALDPRRTRAGAAAAPRPARRRFDRGRRDLAARGRGAAARRRRRARPRRVSERPGRRITRRSSGCRSRVCTEDDVGAARRAAADAVALAVEAADELTVVAFAVLAQARLHSGDLDGAEETAGQALAHPAAPQRPFGYVSALATAAIVAAERDRPLTARAHVDRALDAAAGFGIEESPSAARAYMADALTARREGRLDRAERAAERALKVRAGAVSCEAWMLLELASIQIGRGRLARAERSLARARESLSGMRDAGAVAALADSVSSALEDVRSGEPDASARGATVGGGDGGAAAAAVARIVARGRRRAVPVGAHRQVARPCDLPQARRAHARGGRRPRDRARADRFIRMNRRCGTWRRARANRRLRACRPPTIGSSSPARLDPGVLADFEVLTAEYADGTDDAVRCRPRLGDRWRRSWSG